MTLVDEKKDVNQWEFFSYFIRLVNAVVYVKLTLSSEDGRAIIVNIEQTEREKTVNFQLLKQEVYWQGKLS